jgi:hypothetical protein
MGAQRGPRREELPGVSHATGSGTTRIASVMGEQREGLARHLFVGGNAFVLRILNRFRAELGVAASSPELEATARHAAAA